MGKLINSSKLQVDQAYRLQQSQHLREQFENNTQNHVKFTTGRTIPRTRRITVNGRIAVIQMEEQKHQQQQGLQTFRAVSSSPSSTIFLA